MAAIYHFLIDRRTLTGLVLAGVLIGGLLFFAGLLVGLHQNLDPEPSQTATIPTSAAPSATVTAPVQPATTSPPSVRVPTAPRAQMPARTRSSTVNLQVAATSPGRLPAGDEETPTSETEPTASMETATPVGNVPTETAAVAEPAPPPTPRRVEPTPRWVEPAPLVLPEMFSIQVGAYREQRYLEAAIQDLEERGYSPYTVGITGAGGLVFQTVRIGRYRTRDEAIRAASEFQHHEEMMALVRTVPAQMLDSQPSPDTVGPSSGTKRPDRLAGL